MDVEGVAQHLAVAGLVCVVAWVERRYVGLLVSHPGGSLGGDGVSVKLNAPHVVSEGVGAEAEAACSCEQVEYCEVVVHYFFPLLKALSLFFLL